VQDLNLPDLSAYRAYLEARPEEWRVLDSLCWIPISRLLRDRVVFDRLSTDILPQLAAAAVGREARELRAWSAGCASGEEPYSLSIVWKLELASRFPDLSVAVVATDIDERLLERARDARYKGSSLRELPPVWVEKAFTRSDGLFALAPEFREGVEFLRQDVRVETPLGPFDLILCRNLVFTYFDAALQRKTLQRILRELRAGGALVVGGRERLPPGASGVEAWEPALGIYRRAPGMIHESSDGNAAGGPKTGGWSTGPKSGRGG
jgi:chemotaxis protein methyltransferase CheR